MSILKPIDRSCLQAAYCVCIGHDIEDEVYITRDGRIFCGFDIETIDPASGNPLDAAIVALAQAMKLHITGVQLSEIRDDLIKVGPGVEFANKVHDHLKEVSSIEWRAVNDRTTWYADDMTSTDDASSGRIR